MFFLWGGLLLDTMGFDGFASIIAIASVFYGLVLVVSSLPFFDLGVQHQIPADFEKCEGKTLASVSTVLSFQSHRSKR